MKTLKVVLGDLSYYNRYTHSIIMVPLNVGFVGQYINQVFGEDIRTSIYKSPVKLLEAVKESKPDIVGLSLYYWNTGLNQHVIRQIRSICGDEVVIVLGGPSIDEDEVEQKRLLERFPGVDALIVNEGELGFSNIVKAFLSNNNDMWSRPIDGAVFLGDSELVKGESIGLSLDLATLGSPYLSGLMDDFLYGKYRPLIQTSRFCPYTCTFCVSGKLRGKLRAFPEEQVFEEITFLSKIYADRPNYTLHIADENFGIFERDHKFAAHIRDCFKIMDYPKNVFFYNDKRFTDTSRKVVEILGDINKNGLILALQTENAETLKAINRRNVSDEEIDNAIAWAKNLDISTTTEVIFGMPFETRDSFVDLLNRSVNRGFDSILCHNLFLVDGIELNRPEAREKYKIQTKFRMLGTNYGSLNGDFFAEHEEVVVATDNFSFEDFLEIRGLNFLFYAVFALDFYKWFFQYIRSIKVPLVEFFRDFLHPDLSISWPKDYLLFLDDFKNTVEGELFDTEDELKQHAQNVYRQNNNEVGQPQRLNIYLGARLIFIENSWLKDVLKRHLEKYVDMGNEEIKKSVDFMLDLCSQERINPREIKTIEPLSMEYDVISWKKSKFREPLQKKQGKSPYIKFSVDDDSRLLIEGFQEKYNYLDDTEFYYNALDYITPRWRLLHNLNYVELGKKVVFPIYSQYKSTPS